MSSFSGLNTALSSLIAQRQALEVTGQNLANVNTPGYTRQRANLESIEGTPNVGMSGVGARSGGVKVSSYERLGDLFLETRVRQELSASSHLSTLSTAWTRMETALQEPGESGLSAQLQDFFASWGDIGNDSRDARTARTVMLEKADALISRMQNDYTTVRTQWETLRQQATARVEEVNEAAAAVANLNTQIRSITVAGGSPSDLIDQRALLATTLAGLVGAEARERSDGTLDIMVGGNALVRGSVVSEISLAGTTQMTAVDNPNSAVHLVWADGGRAVDVKGGELSGILASLAPSADGGPLAGLAKDYNTLATEIAAQVNALHQGALRTDGSPGGNFFTDFPAGYTGNAVLDIKVLITDPSGVATAAPGAGPLDSSIGDAISRISTPGDLWSRTVSSIGTRAGAATDRATTAQITSTRAQQDLLAGTGVNSDEETMNLLMYQRGYEAAARLVTTIDEMLDVLINRTGTVGR